MTVNEFDIKAGEWDNDPAHWERSVTVAAGILRSVPVTPEMKAMEYGAGTGILSFLLSDCFSETVMMDNSSEMVKVMNQKVKATGKNKLRPVLFDLEKANYKVQKFDCIFSQMVFHHIADINKISDKFFSLLNNGGFLAIADLYAEDGSFHQEDFKGHHGFDPDKLLKVLEKNGFTHVVTEPCYVRKKMVNDVMREYPIFLLVVNKI
jgi:tRNA (cmo5U34)-methyltransferase